MSRIESSLGSGSVTNLPSRGQVSQEPPSSAHNLRSQLEQQSAQLKGLHDDLTQLRLSEHLESNSSLAELEAQVIKRRKQMNKKRDQLKRIQYDGKIDAMISLAEIEFSVEKDQVEMLSLSQKIKDLKLEECKRDGPKQESLFSLIPENKKMVLVTRTLDRKQFFSGVRMRREGAGLELIIGPADMSGTRGLRILEVNGQHVLRVQEVRWREMRESLECPAKIVLMTDDSDNYKLTEDIAAIQTRLNQKLREGRHVSQELATVQAEREALTRANTCLMARISQLEAQTESLQTGMRHVRDSLATCLNNGVLHTLNKLDTCRHVGHDSSSTSGICSAEDGSDGSSSSQYNSWRGNQTESSEETKSRITERPNIDVWTRDSAPAPTVAALRQRLGEENIYENLKLPEIRNTKLDRANSTVQHRVSNLIRWPRNKFKQQEKKVLSNFV